MIDYEMKKSGGVAKEGGLGRIQTLGHRRSFNQHLTVVLLVFPIAAIPTGT
jgi:hypothetical protein